jgi:hypothetical protein
MSERFLPYVFFADEIIKEVIIVVWQKKNSSELALIISFGIVIHCRYSVNSQYNIGTAAQTVNCSEETIYVSEFSTLVFITKAAN